MPAVTHAQALYRRWRPQTFDEVVGQEHITHTLRNAVATGRLAHAYLFTGPRGTGKTSVARILAKAANCAGEGSRPCNACPICRSMSEGRSLDLIEIDGASNTGVDDVRDLREKIGFAPNEATFKVYVVDEVHMLSTAAFNALLKTLEEPPPHAIFVLATTEPHKIPETIASRCQRYDFRRAPLAAIVGKLERICAAEGIAAEGPALDLIARTATGSVRDAESLLDQMTALGETVTVAHVREVLGTPADDAVVALVAALIAGDAGEGLRLINAALDRGADPRHLQGRVLDHLRALLLLQTGMDAALLAVTDEQLAQLRDQAARVPAAGLLDALHRFKDARAGADLTQPSLPLELALVETVLCLRGELAPGGENVTPPAATAATPPATPAPAVATNQTAAGTAPTTPGPSRPAGAAEDTAPAPVAPFPTRPGPATRQAGRAEAGGGRRAAPGAPVPGRPTEGRRAGPRLVDAADGAADRAAGGGGSSGAPGAPDEAGPPSAEGLSAVRRHWPAILAAVAEQDKNTAALLKDCRPVAADGAVVTLGFFYEFHCRRMSEARRSALLADAVSRVLGARHSVRCVVAAPPEAEGAPRPRTVSDQARQDPVVRHAVEELGARIAGVTSEPDEA